MEGRSVFKSRKARYHDEWRGAREGIGEEVPWLIFNRSEVTDGATVSCHHLGDLGLGNFR